MNGNGFAKCEKPRLGFTLIELLIVVAIIAILAAIAVPNFLEAQTRSKIARVKNDMRSTATAIESYIVDWGQILGTRDTMDRSGLDQSTARLLAYSKMTTPVAYMTSFPRDPFQFGAQNNVREEAEFQFQTSHSYSTNNWEKPRYRGYFWVINSLGPALGRTGPTILGVLRGKTNVNQTFVYDGTNGTVSMGFIIRTNKGEYVVDTSPGF
ncbi:MAG: Type II secretion system protein G precursor [candidate division BRC1 bacterium ADurb.BinA364]|nr:MAG: Type II secretion system protein G precursor [candidate division BRC1 bacterium ADurb.BinA364]